MVFPNKPFYVVDCFGLGKKGNIGSYGFSIGLDPNFAKRFYDRVITQEESDNMNRRGKDIVRNIFDLGKREFVDTPYSFLENEKGKPTLFLQWCSVIGNACDLGLDGMDLDSIKRWDELTMGRLIEYGTHNVDTLFQASALFTIWNEWARMAYAQTSK